MWLLAYQGADTRRAAISCPREGLLSKRAGIVYTDCLWIVGVRGSAEVQLNLACPVNHDCITSDPVSLPTLKDEACEAAALLALARTLWEFLRTSALPKSLKFGVHSVWSGQGGVLRADAQHGNRQAGYCVI